METLWIIIAGVQIIVLIVFFVMASNVSKIKDQLQMNAKKMIEEGDMEFYAGNKGKAKEYYLKAKYRMDKGDASTYNNDNVSYPGMSRSELDNKIEESSK